MFIALSLFLPYLFGLGCLVRALLSRVVASHAPTPLRREDAARDFAVTILAGLLANHAILLALGGVAQTLLLGSILAVAGLVIAVRTPGPRLRDALRRNWLMAGFSTYLILLYVPNIFLEPLSYWDARSIWFFHGKMIYFNRALNEATGWTDPTLEFSLTPYPKLAPGLAAEFAYVAGFWNEHFPKAALLSLLVPAIVGAFAFIPAGAVSATYLFFAVFFAIGWWLWNGAMDGYLAVYTALSTLFVGRWFDRGDDADLYAGFIFLGVATNLKNEGILFCLALLASVLVLAVFGRPVVLRSILKRPAMWAWLTFSLLAITLWYLLKWKWGIVTDPFVRLDPLAARLSDGSVSILMNTLLFRNGVAEAFGLCVIAGGLAHAFRARGGYGAWLPLITAAIYFTGMAVVYLGTIFDFVWHVGSSSERTMLTVITVLGASTFTFLQRIETASISSARTEHD